MCDIQHIVRLAEQKDYAVQTFDDEGTISVTSESGTNVVIVKQEDELLMESVVAPASRAKDPAELNAAILKSHHRLFPMTAVGINPVAGEDYYVAFSVLPSIAKEETVFLAMENLFQSVMDITQTFRPYFN